MEYAGFSVDSSMVAVGDLSGVIKVFYLFTKKEVWTFETADLQVCTLYNNIHEHLFKLSLPSRAPAAERVPNFHASYTFNFCL